MYKVIKDFRDLKDGSHTYAVGDVYPREGVKVSEVRLAELASKNNRRKEPLIEEAEEAEATGAEKAEEAEGAEAEKAEEAEGTEAEAEEKKATKKPAKKAEAKTSAE